MSTLSPDTLSVHTSHRAGAMTPAPVDPSYVPPVSSSSLRVQPAILDPYVWQQDYNLPWFGRIGLFIIDLVLVPLRLIFIILLMALLSLICRILLIGAASAEETSKIGWKGFGKMRTSMIRRTVKILGRPICWCFGLVVSTHKHAGANPDASLMISNHMGYVEIMILVAAYAPSVVAKKEIASYPLIGTIARALQCIFIDRKDPSDRQRVMTMMTNRANNTDNRFPPLLIFPEGTTGNGATMLKFQKGIFSTGKPIQPMAVQSHFIWFNAGWVNGDLGMHVLKLLTRLYHPLSIQELPLYSPCSHEIDDPILYADNVCQTVANALLLPVSNQTMFDNPELQATIKHRQHAAAAAAAAAGTKITPVAVSPNTTSPDSEGQSSPNPKRRSVEFASGGDPLHAHSDSPKRMSNEQPSSARKQGWSVDSQQQQQQQQQTTTTKPSDSPDPEQPSASAHESYRIEIQADQQPNFIASTA